MSEPTVPSSLPKRKAATTTSAVRTRLILTIPVRSPGPVGRARPPWPPRPRSCPVSHWPASSRSAVTGVSCTGSATTAGQPLAALVVGQLEQAARRPPRAGRRPRSAAGVSLGEPLHPRRGRVDALGEQVELLHAVHHHDHLAVEHQPLGRAAPAPAPPPPGSSGSSGCRCGSGGARRRRRGTRSCGSRPTSARSATRRPRAAPRASARAGA